MLYYSATTHTFRYALDGGGSGQRGNKTSVSHGGCSVDSLLPLLVQGLRPGLLILPRAAGDGTPLTTQSAEEEGTIALQDLDLEVRSYASYEQEAALHQEPEEDALGEGDASALLSPAARDEEEAEANPDAIQSTTTVMKQDLLYVLTMPAREFQPDASELATALQDMRERLAHRAHEQGMEDRLPLDEGLLGFLAVAATPSFQERNPLFCGCLHAFLRHVTSDQHFDLGTFLHLASTGLLLPEAYVPVPFLLISAESLQLLGVFKTTISNITSPHSKVASPCLLQTLDKTHTRGGHALLVSWLKRPLVDLRELGQRQRTIRWALQHRPACRGIVECLLHFRHADVALDRLEQGCVSLKEWQHLLLFCFYALKLKCLVDEELASEQGPSRTQDADDDGTDVDADGQDVTAEPPCLLLDISDHFDMEVLEAVAAQINETIDFDATTHHVSVKHGVSPGLDELKRIYGQLDQRLSAVARAIAQDAPFPSLQVLYFPQLGFLVALPLESLLAVQPTPDPELSVEASMTDLQGYGMYYQFESDGTYYYKCDAMFALDEELGDLHSLIVDRELEIVHALSAALLPQAQGCLRRCLQLASTLDVLLALAEMALQNRWVQPTLVREPMLDIRQGRHPWQETLLSYIPNDSVMQGNVRTLVITGPNASGKSMYLKQVALLVLLAQIGSWIPATRATIGLVDKILLRLSSPALAVSARGSNASSHCSSFRRDLKQVHGILQHATPRSLVVLDEFGQGTSALDGIGLFVGTLKALSGTCRRVLCATHFHEIFDFGLLPVSPASPFCHLTMSILEHPGDAPGGASLTFLYALAPAVQGPGKSWGFHCAKLSGIPGSILSRGREVAECIRQHRLIPKHYSPAQQAKLRRDARVLRHFLALDCAHGRLDGLWDLQGVHVDGDEDGDAPDGGR